VFADWVEDPAILSEPDRQSLFGALWHCSDIMPALLCDELDMPRGSTYASAVQLLAEHVEA
jgi:hypothetical protein